MNNHHIMHVQPSYQQVVYTYNIFSSQPNISLDPSNNIFVTSTPIPHSTYNPMSFMNCSQKYDNASEEDGEEHDGDNNIQQQIHTSYTTISLIYGT